MTKDLKNEKEGWKTKQLSYYQVIIGLLATALAVGVAFGDLNNTLKEYGKEIDMLRAENIRYQDHENQQSEKITTIMTDIKWLSESLKKLESNK